MPTVSPSRHPERTPSRLVRELVSDIVLVNENQLEHAVQTYLEIEKTVAEGGGAAPLACLLANPERFRGRKVGLVLSGGNIDSRVLSMVIEHGLVRDGRMVRLSLEIPDTPGILARVSGIIGESGANIIEVHHQRAFSNLSVKLADLDIVLETLDRDHIGRIAGNLRDGGFQGPTGGAVRVAIARCDVERRVCVGRRNRFLCVACCGPLPRGSHHRFRFGLARAHESHEPRSHFPPRSFASFTATGPTPAGSAASSTSKGFEEVRCCVKEGDLLPDDFHDIAGAVIFGGPMSANDDGELDFIAAELRWIDRVLESETPFLGVCLGAQMLARCLGATVKPHDDGWHEIGFTEVVPTEAGRPVLQRYPPFLPMARGGVRSSYRMRASRHQRARTLSQPDVLLRVDRLRRAVSPGMHDRHHHGVDEGGISTAFRNGVPSSPKSSSPTRRSTITSSRHGCPASSMSGSAGRRRYAERLAAE